MPVPALKKGCRLAVFWEYDPDERKEPGLFTAVVESISHRFRPDKPKTQKVKHIHLLYADGQDETIAHEELLETPHVRLPPLWPVLCGSGEACLLGERRGGDVAARAAAIDLETTLDHKSSCAVCCNCSKVLHLNCATSLERRYAEDQRRRARRLKTFSAEAATQWMCPDCFKATLEPGYVAPPSAAVFETNTGRQSGADAGSDWPVGAKRASAIAEPGSNPVAKRPRASKGLDAKRLELLEDARLAKKKDAEIMSLARASVAMPVAVGKKSVGAVMGSRFSHAVSDPNQCELCHLCGDIPECEGRLLGPYEVGSKKCHAHQNCLAWAPESHQFRVANNALVMEQAENVFVRARSQKCMVCRRPGASLSCMYMETKCCQGMHFRCALLCGASFVVDLHGAFITFCPKHKTGPYKPDHDPVPPHHLRLQTPLRADIFEKGRLCVYCKQENFVFDSALLECVTCSKVMHSQCALPSLFKQGNSLMTVDGAFAMQSKDKKFHCRDCVECYSCHEKINFVKSENGAPAYNPRDLRTQGGKVEICVGCNHTARHVVCPKPGVGTGDEDAEGTMVSARLASRAASTVFRCEMCRICKHCGDFEVPAEGWDEGLQACGVCSTRHAEGHLCPICVKAYREDEPCMMQCDGCDKWVHGVCCDLDELECAALGESDDPFYCAVCETKAAAAEKAAKAKISKAKRRATASAAKAHGDDEVIEDAGALVTRNDPETKALEKLAARDWDEESRHDVAMYYSSHVRPRTSKHVDSGRVVPFIDLCRRCGSGGDESHLRFCADCGECVHGYCLKNELPQRDENCNAANSSPGTVRRFTSGGLGETSPLWRCDRCSLCKECGSRAVGSGDIRSCEHCADVFHSDCISAAGPVDEKKFLCPSCKVCEFCLKVLTAAHHFCRRLVCDACVTLISSSKPCTVCDVAFPALPSTALIDSPRRDGEVFASKCQSCDSIVHRQCDIRVGSELFSCRSCVEKSDCHLCKEGSHSPRFHEESITGKRKLVGRNCADRTSCLVVEEGDVAMSNSTSPGVDEPAEIVSEEDGKDQSVRALGEDVIYTKISDAGLNPTSVAVQWNLILENRCCDLCSRTESFGDTLGRLLPWKRNMSGASRVVEWAHSVCALWCSGTTRLFTTLALCSPPTCFIVAAEKHNYEALRAKDCEFCGKDGAFVKCSADGDCKRYFHLPCAEKAGCRFTLELKRNGKVSGEQIHLRNLQSLSLLCKEHSTEGSKASALGGYSAAGSSAFSVICRRLNLLTPIRLLDRSVISRRFSESSNGSVVLRTGALTVLSAGALVPNSSLFLEDGALVSTSYQAVRRYWSLRHPGQRCLLLLEVTGTARTGPRFSIRFSDDSEAVITAPSASAAWGKLSAALEMRRFQNDEEGFSDSSLVDCGATFAFGLARCEASVSLLESLPHAFLFKHRYTFKWRSPQEPPDLPFRVPKLSCREPRVASSGNGSARVTGFLPERVQIARQIETPTYGNVPTGGQFQVHVAMGLGNILFQEQGEKRYGAKTTRSDGRASKSRVSGVGEDAMRGKAILPPSMQHRIMLKTWRRRTVVLRSGIEGWGVYATEDISGGEMVIEYMGELIRTLTSNFREEYYNSRTIGCYMFEVTPGVITDATLLGNRARYINHSCDPNCFSRTVAIEHNRRAIIIFAKRDIKRGEELCYDYQFPLDEEDRVNCTCGSKKCVGFMN